jgi:hypothetical protein
MRSLFGSYIFAARAISSLLVLCTCTRASLYACSVVRFAKQAAVRCSTSLSARSRPQEHVATISSAVIFRLKNPKDGMARCTFVHPSTSSPSHSQLDASYTELTSVVSPGTSLFRCACDGCAEHAKDLGPLRSNRMIGGISASAKCRNHSF